MKVRTIEFHKGFEDIYLLQACYLFLTHEPLAQIPPGTKVDFGSDLASSVILAPPVGWPLRLAEAFQRTSR